MPGNACLFCTTLDPVKQFRGRVRVRTPVQRHINEYVGVQQDQRRNFSANAS